MINAELLKKVTSYLELEREIDKKGGLLLLFQEALQAKMLATKDSEITPIVKLGIESSALKAEIIKMANNDLDYLAYHHLLALSIEEEDYVRCKEIKSILETYTFKNKAE